jgi:hypothetical protein
VVELADYITLNPESRFLCRRHLVEPRRHLESATTTTTSLGWNPKLLMTLEQRDESHATFIPR